MSINHLISPLQNPKLDVYVRNVDCEALDVEFDIKCQNLEVSNDLQVDNNIDCDNLTAQTKVEGQLVEATLQMTMNAQVNTNDIVQFYGSGISPTLPDNPFLKDISNGSNLENFSPIYAYVKTRFVDDGTRSMTEYHLNFSAQAQLLADEGVLDFKAFTPFTFYTIPNYRSRRDDDITSVVSGADLNINPDDPVNDLQLEFAYPNATAPTRAIFDITIRTYNNNNNPPYP